MKCEEVDNCAKNPCDANAECKKTGPGAHVCECNKGFHMQNNVCTEINACALQPCDPNATCKKTGPGTYSCTCNKGVRHAPSSSSSLPSFRLLLYGLETDRSLVCVLCTVHW